MMRIIQQPDGLWAIFCTITDTFDALDMTRDELLEEIGERARRTATESLQRQLAILDASGHCVGLSTSPEAFFQCLDMHVENSENCDDEEFNRDIAERLSAIGRSTDGGSQ